LRRILPAVVFAALACAAVGAAAQNDDTARIIDLYNAAVAAADTSDYAAYGDKMKQALALAPGHPALMRHVARAMAAQGRPDEAVAWLRRVVAAGADLGLADDEYFAPLRGREDFQRLLEEVELHRQPLGKATLAYSLEPRDMLPEGIAYDPEEDCFYVGSIRYGKIFRVSRAGRSSEFAAPEGMEGVLGLRVDARRRQLWAVASYMPGVEAYRKERDGEAGVYRFDLDNGAFLARYPLSNTDARHNLNDVVVSKRGTAYITDGYTGAIYTIDPTRDRLEVLLEPGSTYGPNGIALSADERRLYVSQYSLGVVVCDLERGTVEPMRYPEDVVVCGVDGLYLYRGSLVAIQNFLGMQQVSQFYLDGAGEAITGGRVLVRQDPHMMDPTTGALVGDHLFFIANSQLPRVGQDGSSPPPDVFDDTYILDLVIE
jgi:sugar lactone lactonase YvrE